MALWSSWKIKMKGFFWLIHLIKKKLKKKRLAFGDNVMLIGPKWM